MLNFLRKLLTDEIYIVILQRKHIWEGVPCVAILGFLVRHDVFATPITTPRWKPQGKITIQMFIVRVNNYEHFQRHINIILRAQGARKNTFISVDICHADLSSCVRPPPLLTSHLQPPSRLLAGRSKHAVIC